MTRDAHVQNRRSAILTAFQIVVPEYFESLFPKIASKKIFDHWSRDKIRIFAKISRKSPFKLPHQSPPSEFSIGYDSSCDSEKFGVQISL